MTLSISAFEFDIAKSIIVEAATSNPDKDNSWLRSQAQMTLEEMCPGTKVTGEQINALITAAIKARGRTTAALVD
ncbi:hypothetical protein ACFFTN_21475 [Aminobacter aganoensis]|uniref:Uncharacterized protein n=1 Tax=Aminobacter aganoensis TaxID=83264 RepID=A0A7X0FCD0_9HYPH|nr:hypothetical protein [Aminobacter aganoensis]MBB6357141.1 hypothetical protein [Aminobacter aganoensis]